MPILIGRLVTWLAASCLTFWTGYKTFLISGFLAFLAASLYSLVLYAVQDLLHSYSVIVANSSAPIGSFSGGQFTGVAGWLLVQFKIPQCLVFIIDIIMLKWTLRKIPVIKW